MLKKHRRKIRPLLIHRFHKCIFLSASPAFDLLFPRNRVAWVVKTLVVPQPIHPVHSCETFNCAILMLSDSSR